VVQTAGQSREGIPEPAAREVFSFARVEKKYLLTPEQFRQIVPLIGPRMCVDMFGRHTINSVYYDTRDYALIRRSLEHPVYKEKFRVRCYGDPRVADTWYPEIKKKYRGVVYKRRVSGTPEETLALLRGTMIPGQTEQIQREILHMFGKYDLRPACYVGYERTAWYCPEDPALRLTFDEELRARGGLPDLRDGAFGEPILPDGRIVMEIKFPDAAPRWLVDILNRLSIRPSSMSKYGVWFTRHARELCRF